MVTGIRAFAEYFLGFEDNYTVIGGTACDRWIAENGLRPRATKDIDMLIVLESYNAEFNQKLWQFISHAGYASMLREHEEQKFYRFNEPADTSFPFQLELLCKKPEVIQIPEGRNVTPLPPGEDISHLSAMVINDAYYELTLKHSHVMDSVRIAKPEALICLKALAFLNLTQKKENGGQVNSDDIKTHKYDVFRLTAILSGDESFALPAIIASDLRSFLNKMAGEENNCKQVLAAMGAPVLELNTIIDKLRQRFNLHCT